MKQKGQCILSTRMHDAGVRSFSFEDFICFPSYTFLCCVCIFCTAFCCMCMSFHTTLFFIQHCFFSQHTTMRSFFGRQKRHV